MTHCDCDDCREGHAPRRRTDGLFTWAFRLMILYVVVIVGAGTLANTGHPVAEATGALVRTVTLVDPLIGWADARGLDPLADVLGRLAGGLQLHGIL